MQPSRPRPLPPQLRVRALVIDIDGVATDGGLILDGSEEGKVYNALDGHGIRLFQRAGLPVAILTGRRSKSVERRAAELGIEAVVQDAKVKLPELTRLAERLGVGMDEICYVGDDVADLPCMRAVGLPVAVANAVEPVRQAARCVTRRPGGGGAIREVVEWILKSQGRWAALMERYNDF